MKKIVCILFTLWLLILAVGCSSENSDSQSASKVTNSASISPTTTSDKTIIDNTSTQPSNGSIEFKSDKLGFSFIIPESWKNKYRIEENDTSVSLYFKPSSKSESDGQGLFFTIIKKTEDLNENIYDTIGTTRYIQAKGITYLIGGPTDVNFSDSNPEFKIFQNMKKDILDILKTLKVS